MEEDQSLPRTSEASIWSWFSKIGEDSYRCRIRTSYFSRQDVNHDFMSWNRSSIYRINAYCVFNKISFPFSDLLH
jgi:hypothetical protein